MITNNQILVEPKRTQSIIENTSENMMEVTLKTINDIWIGDETVDNKNGFKINNYGTEKIKLAPNGNLHVYSIKGTILYIIATEVV